MHAIILSIGDELALGQTVDTNSAWLAGRLAGLGIPTLKHETVADDLPALVETLKQAADRADVVLVSGGLGPTEDDLTRDALAQAMGVPLVEDADALAALRGFFDGRGYAMPARNRVQALYPDGGATLPNARGTAPGLRVTLGRATVYVTPGVPHEMKHMFDAAIEPELVAASARDGGVRDAILTRKVNTFGIGESDAAERLGGLMSRDRNPKVGTTVARGYCSIRIRSEFAGVEEAGRALEATTRDVEARLGPLVFGHDDATLAGDLVARLRDAGQTVATAESCTGGLLGGMIVDVPGSSAVYPGGWVTYSNALKQSQLGVPATLLDAHGAVSAPVVAAMAAGARERAGATCAVSISGVAGPDGGTDDKPVGTVWFGLATPAGVTTHHARLVGGRAAVRDRAAKCALQMLRFTVMGEDLKQIRWLNRG